MKRPFEISFEFPLHTCLLLKISGGKYLAVFNSFIHRKKVENWVVLPLQLTKYYVLSNLMILPISIAREGFY